MLMLIEGKWYTMDTDICLQADTVLMLLNWLERAGSGMVSSIVHTLICLQDARETDKEIIPSWADTLVNKCDNLKSMLCPYDFRYNDKVEQHTNPAEKKQHQNRNSADPCNKLSLYKFWSGKHRQSRMLLLLHWKLYSRMEINTNNWITIDCSICAHFQHI